MLPIAISSCPNDTYLFYAWIKGFVGQEYPLSPTYADIDSLNKWAQNLEFPLIKVSMPCYGKIRDHYTLLPVGMALGFGVGPKVIAKKKWKFDQIAKKKVAIPGLDTTANMLFDCFFSSKEKVFCPYDQVMTLIKNGEADLGVIIHETRFTFEKEGLVEIADLGTLWENKFSLPLPLGGIAVKRNLGLEKAFSTILQKSFLYAKEHFEQMFSFILEHSIEKDVEVVKRHIDLYVNSETFHLSHIGKQAVEQFLTLGEQLGYYIVD